MVKKLLKLERKEKLAWCIFKCPLLPTIGSWTLVIDIWSWSLLKKKEADTIILQNMFIAQHPSIFFFSFFFVNPSIFLIDKGSFLSDKFIYQKKIQIKKLFYFIYQVEKNFRVCFIFLFFKIYNYVMLNWNLE